MASFGQRPADSGQMFEKGKLLQVKSFDNAAWRCCPETGRMYSHTEFIHYPETVISMGVSARGKNRSEGYTHVLSSSLGLVWVGAWCLGEVGEDYVK